jgi:hypothetical protein
VVGTGVGPGLGGSWITTVVSMSTRRRENRDSERMRSSCPVLRCDYRISPLDRSAGCGSANAQISLICAHHPTKLRGSGGERNGGSLPALSPQGSARCVMTIAECIVSPMVAQLSVALVACHARDQVGGMRRSSSALVAARSPSCSGLSAVAGSDQFSLAYSQTGCPTRPGGS